MVHPSATGEGQYQSQLTHWFWMIMWHLCLHGACGNYISFRLFFFFGNIHMLNYKWSGFCEGCHIAKITVSIWLIDLDLIKLVWLLLHVPQGCIDLGRCTFNFKDLMIFHREHFDTIWWIQICDYKAFSLWLYWF